MRSETVELDARFGKEYAGRYVFQEITWAKRSRIIQKHTRYHAVTGQVLGSDFVAIQAETVWASLREQPSHRPVTLDKLLGEEDGIPAELGELLCKAANRLCGIARDEERFLSAQSDEADRIQRSHCFDCAKNSDGRRINSQCSQPKPSRSSS